MRTLFALAIAIYPAIADDAPGWNKVAPILNQYCAGCHSADDSEGGLSLETWADLQTGGDHGRTVVPFGPESSSLLRRITGEDKPQMPPEDNEAPTADEIKILKAWIEHGAKGPDGTETKRKLMTPRIAPAGKVSKPVTAIDWSPNGKFVAEGKFGQVSLGDAKNLAPRWKVTSLAGKVNSLRFSRDGRYIAVASGVTGLSGKAVLFDVERGIISATFEGHRDTLYTAVLSPDAKLLATAGYDRKIILWDVATKKQLRVLEGHNGAVFDLDFAPDGEILASASADQTVKIWNVATGQRLDTRSEPLDEQYVVRFNPEGTLLLGGGADNRIRVWKVVSKTKPGINPLVYARFAHEGPVTHLRFSQHGDVLISAAEDKSIKLWETRTFTSVHAFESQPTTVASLALAPTGDRMLVGRMDGSVADYVVKLPRPPFVAEAANRSVVTKKEPVSTALSNITDAEPNTKPKEAQAITVPATISGVIDDKADGGDVDLYRFAARKGEEWIIEVNAARSKSLLDSHVAILTPDGKPVPQVMLRAVRDSYFTFRGKNSDTSDDFRVHNWEEMELNEFIYSSGEVARLWHYPRGPDSGFRVYPGRGRRYGYFNTTPLAHALHEPCYIVEAHPPGSTFVPNGLPVFTVNYENDDESRRKLGTDSKLFFTVPKDGQYLVRIKDTRGFEGPKHKYTLQVRQPQPGFKVRLNGANPTINEGSGREFNVVADRIDGFDGPIRVDIENLPPGYRASSPIIIQAGQDMALGTINVEPGAPAPTKENANKSVVTATAFINKKKIEQKVNNLGTIKTAKKPKLIVTLKPSSGAPAATPDRPSELTIAPGETITARVIVERNGFKGRVDFGKDDSGRNLPHGVYVDNIGLNGLMIVEGQTEREFFITAAKWVPETSRLFHLRASAEGGQVSWPVLLHVRQKQASVAGTK